MLNAHSKRWYDQDPTVSLAISILRNTSHDNQLYIADILIKNGKKFNIEIKKKIPIFKKRWFDQDEKMFESIEYFRLLPSDEQKRVAIEIIEYLYNLDSTCNQV